MIATRTRTTKTLNDTPDASTDGSSSSIDAALRRPERAEGCTLDFSVAQSRDEVLQAWGLVYNAYRRLGIIDPNPWGVHATTHAFTNDTAVIRGCVDDKCVATVSTYRDHPVYGLPLDAVYGDELNRLRDQGCELVEVGLLADRRADISRTRATLFELMRWGTHFGLTHGARHAVIGVHPHHAKFYAKCMGFKIIGEVNTYNLVNGAPVVPLYLNWHECLAQNKLARGVKYTLERPMAPEEFAGRKSWQPLGLTGRTVQEMLLSELCRPAEAA